MAASKLRPALDVMSADVKVRIGDILDVFQGELTPDHTDLLQEISFKVGMLTSVIADREFATADVDRQWKDHLETRANRRLARQHQRAREAGK